MFLPLSGHSLILGGDSTHHYVPDSQTPLHLLAPLSPPAESRRPGSSMSSAEDSPFWPPHTIGRNEAGVMPHAFLPFTPFIHIVMALTTPSTRRPLGCSALPFPQPCQKPGTHATCNSASHTALRGAQPPALPVPLSSFSCLPST